MQALVAPPVVDAAAEILGDPAQLEEAQDFLRDEASLTVFQVWWQMGRRPPGPTEVAEMDTVLALDFAYLLRLARRSSQ